MRRSSIVALLPIAQSDQFSIGVCTDQCPGRVPERCEFGRPVHPVVWLRSSTVR